MNAIVSLGYCSAAFVSPDGLIATNYHCVERDFIQLKFFKDNDLFKNGFIARSKSDDKLLPGKKYTSLLRAQISLIKF